MAGPPASSLDDRVRNAVEALYREFAAPPPAVIEGCPCCVETRGVDVLLTTPLRALTGQALWRYVSGVFHTIGSVRDFRYFLPRILEIAVTDPGSSNMPETVLGKLGLADWRSWPRSERAAIEALLDVWLDCALARDLIDADAFFVGQETEAVLCGAARAGLTLDPYLTRLREPGAAPVLADLKARFPERPSGFWEDAPEGFEALSAFIANPAVRKVER